MSNIKAQPEIRIHLSKLPIAEALLQIRQASCRLRVTSAARSCAMGEYRVEVLNALRVQESSSVYSRRAEGCSMCWNRKRRSSECRK